MSLPYTHADFNEELPNDKHQQEMVDGQPMAIAAAHRLTRTKFVDWIHKFLDNKKSEVHITIWESYDEYARLHILPYFKPLRLTLAEIMPQHIRDYFSFKREQGLTVNTIKKHLVVIRGALQLAGRRKPMQDFIQGSKLVIFLLDSLLDTA